MPGQVRENNRCDCLPYRAPAIALAGADALDYSLRCLCLECSCCCSLPPGPSATRIGLQHGGFHPRNLQRNCRSRQSVEGSGTATSTRRPVHCSVVSVQRDVIVAHCSRPTPDETRAPSFLRFQVHSTEPGTKRIAYSCTLSARLEKLSRDPKSMGGARHDPWSGGSGQGHCSQC